jgi:hypothetical protein
MAVRNLRYCLFVALFCYQNTACSIFRMIVVRVLTILNNYSVYVVFYIAKTKKLNSVA